MLSRQKAVDGDRGVCYNGRAAGQRRGNLYGF